MSAPDGRLTQDDGDYLIEFRRQLGHPCESVYAALTEPRRLAIWEHPVAYYPELREGATIYANLNPQVGAFALGKVTVVNPPRRFAFRWTTAVSVTTRARARVYISKGPPLIWLRLLAPVLVIATVAVFATGVALLALGHASNTLIEAHQVSFVVWGAVFGVHFLGHVAEMLRSFAATGIARAAVFASRSSAARSSPASRSASACSLRSRAGTAVTTTTTIERSVTLHSEMRLRGPTPHHPHTIRRCGYGS